MSINKSRDLLYVNLIKELASRGIYLEEEHAKVLVKLVLACIFEASKNTDKLLIDRNSIIIEPFKEDRLKIKFNKTYRDIPKILTMTDTASLSILNNLFLPRLNDLD